MNIEIGDKIFFTDEYELNEFHSFEYKHLDSFIEHWDNGDNILNTCEFIISMNIDAGEIFECIDINNRGKGLILFQYKTLIIPFYKNNIMALSDSQLKIDLKYRRINKINKLLDI